MNDRAGGGLLSARFGGPGTALEAGPRRKTAARIGAVMFLALTIGGAGISPARAESTDDDVHAANASNGGVASATTGGSVTIEEITTGENAGNTIVTGDISGSAEFDGGDTAYPTDVVSLEIGPQTVDASGGDGGEAIARPGDETSRENDEGDITIINKNDNRSNAVAQG